MTTPGVYPVIVTATDKWGFTTTIHATVTVLSQYMVTVTTSKGGTASADPPLADPGQRVTVRETPAPGYEFVRWRSAQVTVAPTRTFTMPAAPVSLEAEFTPIQYSITYRLERGTLSGSEPTVYTVASKALTLVDPTRKGYIFTGWTGPGYASPSTSAGVPTGTIGNLTFTAHWTFGAVSSGADGGPSALAFTGTTLPLAAGIVALLGVLLGLALLLNRRRRRLN